MQIGWIDFSRDDRNKVLATLQLLEAGTAIDEIGIGVIRDAFAEILFPGISTIQTRAKYFLLIPYIFAEAEKQKFNRAKDVLEWINKYEDKLVQVLVNNSAKNENGIIGSSSLKQKKVVRNKPSSIYWNGLRIFEILKDFRSSIPFICNNIYHKTKKQNDIILDRGEKSESYDDQTALNGNNVYFSPIKPEYRLDTETSIDLTQKEAKYLYDKMTNSQFSKDSLLSFLLKENLALDDFDELKKLKLPPNLKTVFDLAKSFSDFIIGAHIRYNVIFSESNNLAEAQEDKRDLEKIAMWKKWLETFDFDKFDFKDVFVFAKVNQETKGFCTKFFELSKKCAMGNESALNEIDSLIVKRERDIKRDRAKLRKPEEFQYNSAVHNYKLDYRFSTAKVIIADILKGLGDKNG